LRQRDLQLRHLGAQIRPRHRRVDVDDVAARRVRDHLEQIGACTVRARERDERAAQIVAATRA
jgi:hypothetical protein